MNSQRSIRRFLLLVLMLVIPAGILINVRSNLAYSASWTVGEWLINYAGGFVRRGLPGQVIYCLSSKFGIPPWNLAVLTSLFSWASLGLLLARLSHKILSPVLTFSSFCMASPLIGGYMVRKDCFNLLVLGIVLLLIRYGSTQEQYQVLSYSALAVSGLLGFAAVLSHESYAFYSIPAVLIGLRCSHKKYSQKPPLGTALLLSISPVLVALVLCIIYKGSPDISEIVNASWKELHSIIPGDYTDHAEGSIWALSLSTNEGLNYSLQPVLFSLANGFIWKPMPLALSILIILGTISSPSSFANNKQYFRPAALFVYLTLLLAMVPIFILGHDYGRWLFMITTSTLLIISIFGDSLCSSKLFQRKPVLVLLDSVLLRFHPVQWYLVLLLWGVPSYWHDWSISSFAKSSSLGFLASTISKASGLPFDYLYQLLAASLFVYAFILPYAMEEAD